VEDWIGLSKARVQDPGHNVNTNQILGYVFFYSPQNDTLQEKTNREGFLENASFIQVKNTLLTIFKDLGNRRYNYRLQHDLGRVPKSKHARPDFEKYLAALNGSNNLHYIRKFSGQFVDEVTTAMDNLEESLSFSERLASLGSGLELVYHEMAQPISQLKTTKASLALKKQKIDEDVRDIFIADISGLDNSAEALVELRKSLQPAIGRARKKRFKPYQTFLKVCSLFKSDFIENSISIRANEKINDYEINDFEYAFWIAFLNIMNNAVYWIKKSEKPGEIRFNIKDHRVEISNSGPLINESIIDQIFEYGVTTRTEKNATGLGLSFTRSILTNISWEITAENRSNGPAFIISEGSNE
jgi:signal transduction histidine kinase